jgi:hypothetical protein
MNSEQSGFYNSMKPFLPAIILMFICQSVFSQGRGITQISLTIDSTTTELYKESHALLIGNSVYKYT